ncbi:hypothetical protein FB45DRAFT_901162, partial [Roridomyces roridus]
MNPLPWFNTDARTRGPSPMERLSSLTAALDSGKLPSTQQIDAFFALFKGFAANTSDCREAKLSVQGRILADDIVNLLNAYQQLNLSQNSDNILQQALWHLTTASNADAAAIHMILQFLGQRMFSDTTDLPSELARLNVAGNQTPRTIYDTYCKACVTAQKNPAYHAALSTLLSSSHKWLVEALDSPPNVPLTLETLIATDDQHVLGALSALRTLLNCVAHPQSSVERVEEAAQRLISALHPQRELLKAWLADVFRYARRARRADSFQEESYPGMGTGAAIAAAFVSEAGRMLREHKLGLWATGTGVFIVQREYEEGEKRLAMG